MMFSVIVPAHNSEGYIRRGLESIALQQCRDFELIVVCDRCTDKTEDIAKMYGAKTECVNYGRDGLTRDKGLELATGEWILFMDDDDWFIHDYCFTQLADEINKCDNAMDAIGLGYLCKGRGYVEPSYETIFRPGDAHVWSTCWKHSSIAGCKFGDAMYCSDTYFIRDAKRRVQLYRLFNMPLYYYNFKRPGSQTDLLIRGQIRQSPVAR
jgi:glycosyltransferase involved in cell wall biosynthesis